jgi:DHA1 family bicyclomycin/chloramphenicol resistance-like MFS transporter
VSAPAAPAASTAGLIVLLGCLMMLQPLSTDMYLASLPGLTRTFATSAATVQLTLSVFALAFGIMQLVTGPLSDRFGRRPVLLGGIGLYAAASVACALAPSIEALIVGRLFQAVGCCTTVVVARAIVRDVFGAEGSARALAQALTVLAFGPIVGPVFGGVLEAVFGHRAVFVVLAAFGGMLFVVAARRLAETNRERNPAATRPRVLLANYAHIARAPTFLAYALLGSATYAGLFAFISASSFVLIGVLGLSVTMFGVVYAAIIVGYLLGTLLCQRLLARIGLVRTAAVGAYLAAAGGAAMLALAWLGVHHWLAVALPQFVYMASHGINFPCAVAGTVRPFPRHAGAAAGLFGFLSMAIAALVGAWIGASYDGTPLPLAAAVATAGFVSLGTVVLWIRPHLKEPTLR